jgi:hypothetical protein
LSEHCFVGTLKSQWPIDIFGGSEEIWVWRYIAKKWPRH